jgi:hypothetical protein
MKMEPIERSETSASNTQTPGNYPKETVLHLQHGENSNLKSKRDYISEKLVFNQILTRFVGLENFIAVIIRASVKSHVTLLLIPLYFVIIHN